MIYRLMGALSVFVGATFGLIALAVLIPFLNTYSGSLLVLAVVFGILAWVFLAIGLQLVRPPKRREASAGEGQETGLPHAGPAGSGGEGESRRNGAGSVDARNALDLESADSAARPDGRGIESESTFAGFDGVTTPAPREDAEVDETLPYPEIVGMSIDERLTASPASFKKPYQAPPESDETED